MSVDIRGTTGITAPGYSGDGAGLSGIGKVLQVVSTERRSHLSLSVGTTVDWITVNITPSHVSSKIKLSVMGGVSSNNNNSFSMLLLHRDGVNLAYGDAVGTSIPCWIDLGTKDSGNTTYYQQSPFSGIYIDSPNTTDTITYKVKIHHHYAGTLYVGRTSNIGDSNRTTTMGWLIAEEIGA